MAIDVADAAPTADRQSFTHQTSRQILLDFHRPGTFLTLPDSRFLEMMRAEECGNSANLAGHAVSLRYDDADPVSDHRPRTRVASP